MPCKFNYGFNYTYLEDDNDQQVCMHVMNYIVANIEN